MITGAPTERFRAAAAADFSVTPGYEAVVDALDARGVVFLPAVDGIAAVPDGNRSAVFPERTARWNDRTWTLSAKGIGALAPLYGPNAHVHGAERRSFTGESWLGEAPWGAQGGANAAQAAALSAMAARGELPGVCLCPTIAVGRLPEEAVSAAFVYRRHRGPHVQELRLMPSNVRLYHGSDLALGPMPEETLQAFGARDATDVDAFADRYAATGVALLTIFARSVRPAAEGLEGLWYDDVWLDKDAVLAPDGALCFADLEGIEWVDARSVAQRVVAQFERKLYEYLFGLDAIVRVAERLRGRARTAAERRIDVALRLELALDDDPVVQTVRSEGALDLVVLPRVGEPVRLRLIDLV